MFNAEELRTAKHQVLGLVKALLNNSRHKLSVSSISSSSSSSFGAPTLDASESLDKMRSESMKQLCVILKQNVRVRFDLNMEDLVQASVTSICPKICFSHGCRISPALADSTSSKSRGAAYRLLRNALVDKDSVDRLWTRMWIGTSFDHWHATINIRRSESRPLN